MKVYDLDTNTWTELNQVEGEVPHARSAHAAAVVGDVIYVIGGRFNSNDVNGMCVFFFFFSFCCQHSSFVYLQSRRCMGLQYQDAHMAPRDHYRRRDSHHKLPCCRRAWKGYLCLWVSPPLFFAILLHSLESLLKP